MTNFYRLTVYALAILALTLLQACEQQSTQKNPQESTSKTDVSAQSSEVETSPTPFKTTTNSTGERESTAQDNVQVLAKAFDMPGLDRARVVRLYLPPDYDNETVYYPVLYMHDGQNVFDDVTSYAGEWQVDEALNKLAKQDDFKLIVVAIDNGGEKRMQELGPYDHPEFGESEGQAYLDFIIDVVKPYIDTHYRTKADITNTGIMGSSMGGLMSHYAIYTRPDVFSKAGVYSPSFWYSGEAYSLTQAKPLPKTAKLEFLVGTKEGDGMVEDTNKMLELIRSQQHPSRHLRFEVVEGAEHNEGFWASHFAQSVLWLYQ